MILPIIRKMPAILYLVCFAMVSQAQSARPVVANETEKSARPYRILTSGKEITVKSTKDIKSIMVWTASGDRMLEQKNINATSYNFRITINSRIFFVMLRLADGKTYSEKIGIQ